MLSLPLLLLFIIILCNGMIGEAVTVEAVIDPFPSSSIPEYFTEVATQREFWLYDTFLDAYEDTVKTIASLQTSSWNFIPRYNSIDASQIDGMCHDINNAHASSSIPKFLRKERKSSTTTTTTTTGTKKSSDKSNDEQKRSWNATHPIGFRYDRDTDIDRYLTELAKGCSQDIGDVQIGADRYQKECLDVLQSIVYEPRCTTRYDSRVKCNGEATSHKSSTILSPPRELIGEHFGKESLNIVIVGAGPIGLLLANALSMLPQRQIQKVLPPIRILMLESRADAPALKKGYSRNWQAQLNLLHFRNTVDPRVTKIFASMTDCKGDYEESTDGFVLPLNVIETLLLLSNRDMGATKFLFGIDSLELVDDLKDVPNLILVDATGHRLEPLRRGTVCDGFGEDTGDDCDAHREAEKKRIIYNFQTAPPPQIPWYNYKNSDFYEYLSTFHIDFTSQHNFLAEHGHGLHIARTGDIIYPIDDVTNAPKTVYWIDVHGATLTEKQSFEEGEDEKEKLYANGGALCDWCKKWYAEQIVKGYGVSYGNEEDYKTDFRCEQMCYSEYFSSSTYLLRKDVYELIGHFNDTFVYQKDGWFPLMGYSFNPSMELAHQVEKVLYNHGYSGDPIGMPIRELYPALEASMDTTKLSDADLDLVKALKRISLHFNTANWPTVTQFTQHPFIYTSGVKKKNKCNKNSSSLGDHLEDVPMIRIGDSFTTGDGLAGFGLYTHATMIGVFMDIILYKTRQAGARVV